MNYGVDMSSTSNKKLLDVFDFIVDHGPATPLEVERALSLSHTAVFRSLSELKNRNMLRLKLGNGAYMVSSTFITKIAALPVMPLKLEQLIPEIYTFCKVHKLHCDFFGIGEKKIAKLIETSDPNPENIGDDLLRSPEMILALGVSIPETQLSEMLKNKYPELDKYSMHQIRNWALSHISRSKDHIFAVEEMSSMLIGLTSSQAAGYTANIRPRPNKNVSLKYLREKAVTIQSMVSAA